MRELKVVLTLGKGFDAQRLEEDLLALGYDPMGAAVNCSECLAHVSQESPDLVLVDTGLEGAVDGFATAIRLQRQLSLPVILLARENQEGLWERLREAQPLGCVIWPCSREQLRCALETGLSRWRAERRLRESELRLRLFADFSHDWEGLLDVDGRWLLVSPSCRIITGYSRQEFMDDPGLFRDLVHPDDRFVVESHINGHLESGHSTSGLEFRIITKDGRVRWLSHSCSPVWGPDGIWMGRRVSHRDITQQKLAEEALDKSRQRLRALADGMREGVVIFDAQGVVIYCNVAFLSAFGYQAREVLGRTGQLLQTSEESHRLFREQAFGTAKGTGSWQDHWILRDHDRRLIPVEASLTAVTDSLGREDGHVLLLRILGSDQQAPREPLGSLEAGEPASGGPDERQKPALRLLKG